MMEIKRMNLSHVAQVAALEALCFSDPWSEKSVASELDNPLALWLVAEENGTVVGYVGSQSVLEQADMMNLAVAPEYRRRGIGRLLVTELIRALSQRQVSALALEVRASNAAAKTLYEAVGFLQVGKRPNYYRNPKEDALILKLEF